MLPSVVLCLRIMAPPQAAAMQAGCLLPLQIICLRDTRGHACQSIQHTTSYSSCLPALHLLSRMLT